MYSWKGEICEDEECVLVLKTRSELADRVVEFVNKEHPYDCPEVIFHGAGPARARCAPTGAT